MKLGGKTRVIELPDHNPFFQCGVEIEYLADRNGRVVADFVADPVVGAELDGEVVGVREGADGAGVVKSGAGVSLVAFWSLEVGREG